MTQKLPCRVESVLWTGAMGSVDSDSLKLVVKLKAKNIKDIPGVATAKLCGLGLAELSLSASSDPYLFTGFTQPTLDTGKGIMRLTVSALAAHPATLKDDEYKAGLVAAWDTLRATEAELLEAKATGAELTLTLDWADPVREPELFGGGK